MIKNINGIGRTIEVIASTSLEFLLDPANKRIAIGATLQDASDLRLWMTIEQFQQSLLGLKLSSEKLGVIWP